MRLNVKPLAVVGVPCQIDGVWLQQTSSIQLEISQWYRDNIALTIGLFCSESFTHESIKKLAEIIEVEPHRIDNINIKGNLPVQEHLDLIAPYPTIFQTQQGMVA